MGNLEFQPEQPNQQNSLKENSQDLSAFQEERQSIQDDAFTIEANEKEPTLRLTVKATCNSQGPYVGLSKWQREKLGVALGDSVQLKDESGKIIGERVVGLGLKTLLSDPTAFSVNGVEIGTTVDVLKKTHQ
ncbi:MAG: hypothetical protein AAB373_05090 [Patescibacteria group bacterium]